MYKATGNNEEQKLEAYKKEVDRHDVHMIRRYIIAMLALFGFVLLGAVFPKNVLCAAMSIVEWCGSGDKRVSCSEVKI